VVLYKVVLSTVIATLIFLVEKPYIDKYEVALQEDKAVIALPRYTEVIVFDKPINVGFKEKDIRCLATNIYHEAANEPDLGKALVVEVVMTRSKLANYPKELCDVVYQRAQFSWTLEHVKKAPKERIITLSSLTRKVLSGDFKIPERYKGATHYYNGNIIAKPEWAYKMVYLGDVGNHSFFKDPTLTAAK
jgi:N-acetylmuramoyl-L-alanine amidase